MDTQIQVTGGDRSEELASLWSWLKDEDELRGQVSPMESRIGETDLGGAVIHLANLPELALES
ncbi:hypothetical protein Aple_016880 [Acrocarpospora pleiomorpha]|uniref:Uncharacterized protein n=1 Tax=Acrocarpospora pleiomorpha TaxID=90975 RepID=A0A5M3XIA7_9ACTN|nr:hypothetical protein [Acrocarpospora pleiomorpha]GES18793.1 hypothetical protein Aple_016880 [Acrocarpospora pleiomorpha]